MHGKFATLRMAGSWAMATWLALVLPLVVGCRRNISPPTVTLAELTKLPDDAELERQLDEVLQWTLQHRHLNTRQHAAWQVLHGVLAYQRDFPVEHEGRLVSAVEHLSSGGYINGWTVEPGIVLDEATNRRGLRAIMQPGSGTGQGHYDQWLAVLAQCGLAESDTISAGGHDYTVADYVYQVQWDLPRNLDREYSWTLIALTSYLPTDAEWPASDGRTWSIAQLVQSEAEQPIGEGACGGTHRLIGMTMALNRHLDDNHLDDTGKLEGPWKLADERIQEAIGRARQYQNLVDGSFSSNYLSPGVPSPDLAEVLGTSGHVLEFLVLAMNRQQLEQPWVKRSVLQMCNLFRKTQSVELECGALYHAAHGLALYRDWLRGERLRHESATAIEPEG